MMVTHFSCHELWPHCAHLYIPPLDDSYAHPHYTNFPERGILQEYILIMYCIAFTHHFNDCSWRSHHDVQVLPVWW